MAFREVHMIQVREVLRLWIQGQKMRRIARMGLVDRKTVRRYIEAGQAAGLCADGRVEQLTDEVLGLILDNVRAGGPGVHGETWKLCQKHREFLQEKVDEGLRLTKVHKLLLRHAGATVPYRTLHRFASQELGYRKSKTTVRVADGEPGQELQVDFGLLGRVAWDGTDRKLYALIFTAVYSRHTFVWPTHLQTVEAVLEGFEEAWRFFGGIFAVVIPDNCKAMVAKADACDPKLTVEFLEYCQHRDFVADTTRVRRPKDKPRVERAVPYVREAFFKGETFLDLAEARRRAVEWCLAEAGTRTHGTTRQQPAAVFEAEEKPLLRPAPTQRYDVPVWVETTVSRDQHAQVLYSLYSLPIEFVQQPVTAHADSKLVRFYHQGQLVKTHPRVARGQRSTDREDYPPEVREYAMRDTATLITKATAHGQSIGEYAKRLLDCPLPWTRMRHCYRLLGLVQKYGAARVDEACRRALALDVVDVTRVGRMLAQALETRPEPPSAGPVRPTAPLRFQRPACDFAVVKKNPEESGGNDGQS